MVSPQKLLIICKPGDSKATKLAGKTMNYCGSLKIVAHVTEDLGKVNLSGYSGLIAIGGDGTLNQIINRLPHFRLPLGIIPAGSGNDYVKSINIGKKKREAIETAVHGEPRPVDLGRCNDRLFINGFGLGFDGRIAKEFEENRTILKGHAAYYYHVVKILASYRPRQLGFTIDRRKYDEKILLMTVAKGTTFGGGFKLTQHASVDNGKFAIGLVEDLAPWKRFLNLPRLKNGTHHLLDEVVFREGEKISIRSQPEMVAHIDGEIVGAPPFEIDLLPKKLMIRMKK